jgi:hypothetical protein
MKLRLVIGAACVVASIVPALFARDVWRQETALRTDDARAATGTSEQLTWAAHETLPGKPASRVLGVADDVRFRKLYAHALALAPRTSGEFRMRQRTPVEVALRREVLAREGARRTGMAANVLGVLLFTDPDDPENSPAQRAVGEFQNAALADPSNAHAKSNLELLLRQLQAQSPQGRSSPGGGDQAGNSGVGKAAAGSGY